MSDKFNPNIQASMEGHPVPVMQPVIIGNGTAVPAVQAIPPSQPSGQTSNQDGSNKQQQVSSTD